MAVDTRNKRASIIGLAIAARLALPAPDGAIIQADRQHLAYSYAGLSAQVQPWGYGPIVCLEDIAATVASLADVTSTVASLLDVSAVEC